MTTIDFRNTAWGHNHYIKPQADGTYYGPCWSTQAVAVGDSILWATNYGYAEAEVVESKRMADPTDMYFVRARVIRRIADEAIVSQEEIDDYFD